MIRLAIVVTHPIQYYVPVYRNLALCSDIDTKVFYSCRGPSEAPFFDPGFRESVAWDIDLTSGYSFVTVENNSRNAGTDHFFGVTGPDLNRQLSKWRPDFIHLTGYPYEAHVRTLFYARRHGIPLAFRGDSHRLDRERVSKAVLKNIVLRSIFRLPSHFLTVGAANRKYYRSYGVPDSKIIDCPHTIDVARFASSACKSENEAKSWRRSLNIRDEQFVVLFAGKFEEKKNPHVLMQWMQQYDDDDIVTVLLGNGTLAAEISRIASLNPKQFRVLPFQNQSKMPVVYRLADALVLPSSHAETWGLAINESLASGRPVLVSDKVGCCEDLVHSGTTGEKFKSGDKESFLDALRRLRTKNWREHTDSLISYANTFDTSRCSEIVAKVVRESV